MNTEYVEYNGVELKNVVRCNGCNEDLPFDATEHVGCEEAADLPAEDKVYAVDPIDLYIDLQESMEQDDEDYAYERWRDER